MFPFKNRLKPRLPRAPAGESEPVQSLSNQPLPFFFHQQAKDILSGYLDETGLLNEYERGGRNPGAVEYVIAHIVQTWDNFRNGSPAKILEVGAGTGAYTRALRRHWTSGVMTIYELEPLWREYINRTADVITPECDGKSFHDTSERSIDLVHAHGVFVYLKPLEAFAYFDEIARVCAREGLVVFDFIPFETFSPQAWFDSPHRYAQPLTRSSIVKYFEKLGLRLLLEFEKPWYPSPTLYLVFSRR